MNNAQIYCVLDAQVADHPRLFDILDISAEAGVDIFQIRDKTGSRENVISFTRRVMQRLKGRQLFIVNDDIDVAVMTAADGVHLGQDDASIGEARRKGGEDFIIGASCQTLEQALKAEQEGADYIGFGSVFKTLTKPDRRPMDLRLLSAVLQKIAIPVFPIGGITAENFQTLKDCGAKRAAVTREICLADDIVRTVWKLKSIINR